MNISFKKKIHMKSDRFFYKIPTLAQEKQALDYIKEFQKYESNINGAGGLHKYLNNYPAWIDKLKEVRTQVPTDTALPAETFFLVRESDNLIVGMVNIRLAINENQKKHGGHIGYSIRPTERRKGYNKINLYLALIVCQSHNIHEALLDCESENKGSYKTIEALDGKLIKEYYDDEEDFCFVRNYIIDVDKSIEKYRHVYSPMIAKWPV